MSKEDRIAIGSALGIHPNTVRTWERAGWLWMTSSSRSRRAALVIEGEAREHLAKMRKRERNEAGRMQKRIWALAGLLDECRQI